MNISHYRKTIVALLGGVLAWAQVAYVPDGHLDRGEYYGLAVALATALGVYGVSNRLSSTPPETTDDQWDPVEAAPVEQVPAAPVVGMPAPVDPPAAGP